MIDVTRMRLDEVGGGVVPELFEHELERLLINILDPNTDPRKTRKITVELTWTPAEDRQSATVVVGVKATLAGPKKHATSVFIGREKGRAVAYLRDPKQGALDLEPPVAIAGGSDD